MLLTQIPFWLACSSELGPSINESSLKCQAILGGELQTSPGKGTPGSSVGVLRLLRGGEQGIELAGLCTLTRIAPHWALTASHCVEPLESASLGLRAELSFDGSVSSDPSRAGCFPAVHPLILEEWVVSEELDLALLRIETEPSVDVEIATTAELDANAELLVFGYGVTETGNRGKRKSLFVEHVRDEPPFHVVRGTEDETGACSGDSGGPLFAQTGDLWVIVGVLSKGSPDCTGEDYYTKLSTPEIQQWLNETVSGTKQ